MPDQVFNWNGCLSADPPGLEFWRWSKSAAESADDLVEQALNRADENLRTRMDTYPDPESYGEAEYYLVEEPASFARSGLFCQLAGSFEFALLALCSDAAFAANASRIERHGRDIVLNRLRYLGEITGQNFTDTSHDVFILTKLRNAFAHADGVLMNENDRRSIESWISTHQMLADATGYAVRLKGGFVRYCLETYDRKLTEIAGAIVATMRTRASVRSSAPDSK